MRVICGFLVLFLSVSSWGVEGTNIVEKLVNLETDLGHIKFGEPTEADRFNHLVNLHVNEKIKALKLRREAVKELSDRSIVGDPAPGPEDLALRLALRAKSISKIQEALKRGADPFRDGSVLFQLALHCEKYDQAELAHFTDELIEREPRLIYVSFVGELPSHRFVIQNCLKPAKVLFEIDPNLVYAEIYQGKSLVSYDEILQLSAEAIELISDVQPLVLLWTHKFTYNWGRDAIDFSMTPLVLLINRGPRGVSEVLGNYLLNRELLTYIKKEHLIDRLEVCRRFSIFNRCRMKSVAHRLLVEIQNIYREIEHNDVNSRGLAGHNF